MELKDLNSDSATLLYYLANESLATSLNTASSIQMNQLRTCSILLAVHCQ
jgi:hypothetical protein